MLTDEFYKKQKSVRIVRKGIIKDIIYSIIALIFSMSLYIYAVNNSNDFSSVLIILMIMFMCLCAFSLIAHGKIIREWIISDRKHIKEYDKWLKEKYENKECVEDYN